MATSDAPNTRRLARQLVDVTRRLKHLETVPQLAHSSLDDQGMHVYDADGNLSVTLGKQSDGTYSARPVRGPIPPAPAGLGAEGDAGLVHASWQGVFWAGAASPRDFEAVEVLVDGNVHGAIHDPDGGSVTVPAFAGEREVSFRTLSQAGRRSDATGHVTVTVQSKASVQLDEARGRIEDAEEASAGLAKRVTDAEGAVATVRGDLTTLEAETLPDAVSTLTAADEAAQDELTELDGRLTTAQSDLDTAEGAISSLGADLLAETTAREALDAAVRADLGTLDDKLVTAFPGGVFDVSAELAQTIRNSVVQYAVGTSETTAPTTGWSTTTPVRADGEFIWFRTVITYADATTSTSSPALLTGNAGAPGPKGEDGTGVSIKGSFDTAADLPASGADGDAYLVAGDLYVWDSQTSGWENVGRIQGPAGTEGPAGADGSAGPAGIGVASVTPYYRRLASGATTPAKPTTVTPAGWASTEPAWQAGTELWRIERIVYSDATFAYTDVTKVAVFAGIDAAMTAANGKNKVTYTDLANASKPGPPPAVDYSRTVGDVHRNRSASTGEIWAEYQWSGTAWKPVSFGDGVLASLDVGKLSAGTASIETGVIDQLWADGIMAKSVATTSVTVSASNLLPDPNGNTSVGREAYANLGFTWDPSIAGWTRTSPSVTNQTKPNAGGDYTSYPLEGGRTYRLSFEAYVAGGTGAARYAIYYTRRDGTTAFVGDGIEEGYDSTSYTPVPADTWTKVERAWIAPEDAVVGGFALQVSNVSAGATRVSIRKPYAGVMHSGVHIENGAISADKVQAESVAGAVGEFIVLSTDQLTAGSASIGSAVAQRFWADIATFNSITADSVVVGGVDGAAIADGAVGAVKIADGAITTPKLTVTEDMSAAIVNAMSVNTKKLVVSEEAILNHATLIGDTVVDDINVQGKLIGTDGVFTGTVDFENVNVTGLQLVEKLEANSISADLIEGGHFTGETFEGGSFVGGEFRTSDTLPGRVTLADDAYINSSTGVAHPGIRVEPLDTSAMVRPPGIGPGDLGLYVDGGSDTSGRRSYLRTSPTASLMRTSREDGTIGGEIQTSPTASYLRTYQADGTTIGGSIQTSGNATFMQTYSEDGRRGNIYTDGTSATVRTMGTDGRNTARLTASGNSVTLFSATNGQRYLELNDTGIWIRTGPSGNQKSYNLEETAQDSGWNSFPVKGGITPGRGLAWRNKNGVIYFRGTVQATWSAGWSDVVTGLPTEIRPADDTIALSPDSTDTPMLFRMTSDGTLQVWKQNAGNRTAWVSVLSYPLG